MKTKQAILLNVIALLMFLPHRSNAQSSANTKAIMRNKLAYAQGVLEGITTENFGLISTNAQKLNALSQSADWRVRNTIEYQIFTSDFSRQAVALEKAAKANNIDAATVAYFQLTVSCVNCHKYLRGAREARWEHDGALPRLVKAR
jgi:hypothetical protein